MPVPYEKIISHLKDRLIEELEDEIESIILYGSVARNEAHEDSDIDILIVTKSEDRKLYNAISKIRTRIDLDNNTLTTLVQVSRNELERYIKLGSPFLENIMKESLTLYDKGFFKKIRRSLNLKG